MRSSGKPSKPGCINRDFQNLVRSVRQAGQPMSGVFEVSRAIPIGTAIEDILLLAEYSLEGEWEGQIRYLPLR